MFRCTLASPFPTRTLGSTSRGRLYLHITSSLTSLHPVRGWMGRASEGLSCPSSSSDPGTCTQPVASPDAGKVLGYTERAACFYPQLTEAGGVSGRLSLPQDRPSRQPVTPQGRGDTSPKRRHTHMAPRARAELRREENQSAPEPCPTQELEKRQRRTGNHLTKLLRFPGRSGPGGGAPWPGRRVLVSSQPDGKQGAAERLPLTPPPFRRLCRRVQQQMCPHPPHPPLTSALTYPKRTPAVKPYGSSTRWQSTPLPAPPGQGGTAPHPQEGGGGCLPGAGARRRGGQHRRALSLGGPGAMPRTLD